MKNEVCRFATIMNASRLASSTREIHYERGNGDMFDT
jgi:hypothetical protein